LETNNLTKKTRKAGHDSNREPKTVSRATATAIEQFGNLGIAIIGVVTALLKTLGWPGTALIIAFYFLEKHGTIEQKRYFIDMVFLGKETGRIFWVIIVSVLAGVVCLAQKYYYRNQLRTKQTEIDRLSKWKTDHQEKQVGKDLHHTL
jgi:hypothetical protein